MNQDKIVIFYVMRIKNGLTNIDAVPSSIRADVETILKAE
jgi:hypothetical protein